MCRERVTKVNAAKRQMNEAIRLFFEERDSVAIHTLAAAAGQVLADLCKATGTPSLLRGSEMIKRDRRKEWLAALKSAENFFKHADRDPDAEIEFNVGQTEMVLFDATFMYASLTGRHTYEGAIFQSWFFLKYPQFLLDSALRDDLVEQSNHLHVSPDDFAFFADLLRFRKELPGTTVDLFD